VPAVEVKHWGGAIARPADDDPGPVSHRDARFVLKIAAPSDAAAAIIASATGGSFLNFLHDTTRTHTAFTTENYRRLREVRTAYDPGPGLAVLAALGCAALQVGAVVFHLTRGEGADTPINVLLVALAGFVFWGRRSRAPIVARRG
jgi:hypothetical protein